MTAGAAASQVFSVMPSDDEPTLSQPDDSPAPTAGAGADSAPACSQVAQLHGPRYQLGVQFSRGGMGGIWKATETATGRTVALKKMLRPDNADGMRRFLTEARVTARLEHPNIVPVHELGMDASGQIFYSMKLVQGIDLAVVLRRLAEGDAEMLARYPLSELLIVFQKACDAIAFAHSRNVIHRDLKPANIMLGPFGEMLVMDWGLAKILGQPEEAKTGEPLLPSARPEAGGDSGSGSETLPGSALGTAYYMAPEQATGEVHRHDARTDVYALGAILYHMLSLRRPVSGTRIEQLIARVSAGDLDPLMPDPADEAVSRVPLRHLPGATIPEGLSAVVRRAMAHEPGDRYQSVGELQHEITAFQQGYATIAERAGFGRQLWLAVRRHRREATVASAGLFLLVVVAVAAFQRVRAERDEARIQRVRAEEFAAAANTERIAAETARANAVAAEERTRFRASKADADVALELSAKGQGAEAFAHAVRALELNPANTIAALLAYRLLGDGTLALPSHLFAHRSAVHSMAFSRDGLLLAMGCDDGSVSVCDLRTGRRFDLAERPEGQIVGVAFSPDQRSVSLATAQEVFAWDFQAGSKPQAVANGFMWGVLELAWPHPARIVIHSGRDWGSGGRTTQVFSPVGEKWQLQFGIGDFADGDGERDPAERNRIVSSRAFETWVTTGRPMLVIHEKPSHRLLWLDLAGTIDINRPLHSFETADGMMAAIAEETGMAFVGSNFVDRNAWRRLGSGEASREDDLSLLWIDPATRRSGRLPIREGSSFQAVSSDGERLLFSTRAGSAIMDRARGEIVFEHYWKKKGDTTFLALRRDGWAWALRSHRTTVVLSELHQRSTFRETELALPADVLGLEFDRAGKWMAVATSEKNVRVWSRDTLQKRPLSLHRLDATPAGHVSAGAEQAYEFDDGIIYRRVLGRADREKVATLQVVEEAEAGATGYEFSPDGRRLVVSYGSLSDRPDNNAPSAAVLYDAATGRVLGAPMRHDDDVFSPRFAPGGRWLITTSDDHTLRRWDAETGASLGEPIWLPGRVRYAAFSPKSDTILTGSGYLIDVAKWTIARKLTPAPSFDFAHASFSPDGLWLLTVSVPLNGSGRQIPTGAYGTYPSEVSFVALQQWELQSGCEIGKALEIYIDEATVVSIFKRGEAARWHVPGSSAVVAKDVLWQSAPRHGTADVLSLLQACRPLVFTPSGDKLINPKCSLASLTIASVFGGGTPGANVSRFASEVLATRLEDAWNPSLPDKIETRPAGAARSIDALPAPARPAPLAPPNPVVTEKAADARLNEVYSRLRASPNKAGKQALKDEEMKWLKLRDAIADPAARVRFIEQRTRELESRLGRQGR